jgi:hypothetical protein
MSAALRFILRLRKPQVCHILPVSGRLFHPPLAAFRYLPTIHAEGQPSLHIAVCWANERGHGLDTSAKHVQEVALFGRVRVEPVESTALT